MCLIIISFHFMDDHQIWRNNLEPFELEDLQPMLSFASRRHSSIKARNLKQSSSVIKQAPDLQVDQEIQRQLSSEEKAFHYWNTANFQGCYGGEHFTLQSDLVLGSEGGTFSEIFAPHFIENMPSHTDALILAREMGYQINNEFVSERQKASFGEIQSFYAARSLIRGHELPWYPEHKHELWRELRSKICYLGVQFIVPKPNLDKSTTPYLLDQLWIIKNNDNEFRTVVLEIDGEWHLDIQRKKRDATRDRNLMSMGYEVYRAAEWWSRIDPFRVICEFLQVSDILPNALDYLVGNQLPDIESYRCDLCGHEMCRDEYDWIQEVPIDSESEEDKSLKYLDRNRKLIGHKVCIEKWLGENARSYWD